MRDDEPNETGNGPPDDHDFKRLTASVVGTAEVREGARAEVEHLDAGLAEGIGVAFHGWAGCGVGV
jgi:hypothetical protein